MSYRFVKVTSYYRDFLKQYYAKNPDVVSLSYEQQHNHLMEQAYSWSDFYAKNLRLLGIEAHEIVATAEPLQKTWAKENGIKTEGIGIVFEQLKQIKPDVVFLQDSFMFPSEWIARLRETVPSIKLVIGWCCTNYTKEHLELFKEYDFFLVCSQKLIHEFTSFGIKTFRLNHGFEETLLPKIHHDNSYPETDFIFLGSIVPGTRGHGLRKEVLLKLVEARIDIDLYAHFLTISKKDLFLRRSAYIVAKSLAHIGLHSIAKSLPFIQKAYYLEESPSNPKGIEPLVKIAKPSIYGLEMLKALSKSKVGFNYHGEGAGDFAANIRLFEITGVGSCMITDWKKNLHEFFELDSEVVAFKSAEECIEKVRWLIDHPQEREEIARRGQQRVLREHTYKLRAEQLHHIILENLR